MIKKLVVLAPGLAGGLAVFLRSARRRSTPGSRGAYRFPDGRIVGISPTGEDGIWRVRDFSDGRVHSLYPDSEDTLHRPPRVVAGSAGRGDRLLHATAP